MVVKYPDGRMVEGLLLSQQESSMRVALEGNQDAAEFFKLQNNWVSEHLEPVEVSFEWQRTPAPAPLPADHEFICSPDLAAQLIRMLDTDSSKDEPAPKYMTAGDSVM